MKEQLQDILATTLNNLQELGKLPADIQFNIQVERTRDPSHGDFASNIALMLAKPAKSNPREVAKLIVSALPESAHTLISKTEIAGPGFINFFLNDSATLQVIPTILEQGNQYGHNPSGSGRRAHIEFVSANPTGPLHVGHGRGAAYGACVANLLAACGYQVHREYYVNDAGRQMRILGLSVWLRYLELHGLSVTIPENAYLGDYVIGIARDLNTQYQDRFCIGVATLQSLQPSTEEITKLTGNDAKKAAEIYLDKFIANIIQELGEENFDVIRSHSLNAILDDIREDLSEFGVNYDEWFRESNLMNNGALQAGTALLREHGHVYEKDGAVWFKATDLGDEKDRVLVRENGQPTYFASDVAYHLFKYNQKYDRIIDVFGADHHGYIGRIRAFLKGLGENPDKLTILLVQFAILYRGKEKVSMSTRKGSFVTLRELRHEVSNDAARYFYIMRKPEQHLDFDLELAKSQSSDNPVYYIQYAHARICSVFRQLQIQNLNWNKDLGLKNLNLLTTSHEKTLMKLLTQYPEIILSAANGHAPHLLAHYLQELANHFHTYYNATKFIVEEEDVRNARFCLITSVKQVIHNGLTLLGVTCPEEM
jgi:arginyl-tRNA synthetase